VAKAHDWSVRLSRWIEVRGACQDCNRSWRGDNAQRNAMSHVRQTGHRAKVTRKIDIELAPGNQPVVTGQLTLTDS
jgi:hypothetical protein